MRNVLLPTPVGPTTDRCFNAAAGFSPQVRGSPHVSIRRLPQEERHVACDVPAPGVSAGPAAPPGKPSKVAERAPARRGRLRGTRDEFGTPPRASRPNSVDVRATTHGTSHLKPAERPGTVREDRNRLPQPLLSPRSVSRPDQQVDL